ncbi:hypothetical protein [uncultured Roseobacter sp.]|uniref:hypothetical protein n=1 Tax=uncultured Roseobacter sp. TaxID=114847 RepID=UPI0026393E6F|nr:hypothetical protein [uncultured Roseobacter sp.]
MESAARLLFHDEQGRMARLETIIAVLLEDPDWNISPILAEHLPELTDLSDPRKVMLAFREATLTIKSDIEDALEEDPDVEQRMQVVEGVAPVISDALHREKTPWEQIERRLNQWVIRPVAEAIRATVSQLAGLLGQERRAQRDDPSPQEVATDDDGQKPSSKAEQVSRPKSGPEPS